LNKVLRNITGAMALAGMLVNAYFMIPRHGRIGFFDLFTMIVFYIWIALPFFCIAFGNNYIWEGKNIFSSIIFLITASIVTV